MRLKRSSLLWLTVLAVAVASGCQFFPSYDPVQVTVTVLDGVGQPVAGAEITLVGNQEYAVRTDASGVAVLPRVHPDNYVLTASYPDGYVVNRTLHLWGGENYAFEFRQSHISEHILGAWLFDESVGMSPTTHPRATTTPTWSTPNGHPESLVREFACSRMRSIKPILKLPPPTG